MSGTRLIFIAGRISLEECRSFSKNNPHGQNHAIRQQEKCIFACFFAFADLLWQMLVCFPVNRGNAGLLSALKATGTTGRIGLYRKQQQIE
jgi:hypothetical protein